MSELILEEFERYMRCERGLYIANKQGLVMWPICHL